MAARTDTQTSPVRLLGATCLLLAGVLLANQAAHADEATSETTASAVIRHTVDAVMARLGSAGDELQSRPGALYAMVAEVVMPHFDIPRISRMVLGKASRGADAETLARFSEQFRILLIRTYASSLNHYSGEALEFPIREKAQGRNRASVNLRIQRPGQAAVEMEFRMHNRSGPWLAYDVKIEGVSLIANYRADFANTIRRQGLEALIEQLHARNGGIEIAAR